MRRLESWADDDQFVHRQLATTNGCQTLVKKKLYQTEFIMLGRDDERINEHLKAIIAIFNGISRECGPRISAGCVWRQML